MFVQQNNRDFLNPIKFQLTQRLQDADQPVLWPGQRLPDIDDFPVLNASLAKNLLSVSVLRLTAVPASRFNCSLSYDAKRIILSFSALIALRSRRGSVVNVMDLNPANQGSTPAGTHRSH